MFESTGDEVPAEGAAARVPEADWSAASPESLSPEQPWDSDGAWESNGAWAEHDWSNVPVVPRSDEPPVDWEPETTWLDEIEEVDQGPVAWFDHLAPSGRLMCELENLPSDLVATDLDAVEMVAHWARLEAHCAAQKRRAAAVLARRSLMASGLGRLEQLGVSTHEPNITSDELSLRLGIGRRAAQTLVRSGRAFDDVAIPTGDALDAGEIDAVKADLIVAGIEDLGTNAALEVQDRLLAKAPHIPLGRLRRELATARAAVEPENFEERCKAAVAARRVDHPRPLPDGMASLYAVMPAVEAIQLFRAIDAAARSAKAVGDVRTLDQLRADAFGLMGATAIQTGWIGACPRPQTDDVPPGRGGADDGALVGARAGTTLREPGAPRETAGHGGKAGKTVAAPPSSQGDVLDAGTQPTIRPTVAGSAIVDEGQDLAPGENPGHSSAQRPKVPQVPLPQAESPQGEPAPGDPRRGEPPPGLTPTGLMPPTTAPPADGAGDSTDDSTDGDRVDGDPASRGSGHPDRDVSDVAVFNAEVPDDEAYCAAAPDVTNFDVTNSEMGMSGPGERAAQVSDSCGGMRVGVLGGRSAHIRVVVPLTSMMGGEGGPGADLAGADDPAELEGYGPIPASVARALAAGGTWARMVTDPVDRTVLEVSRDKYVPPPAMADLVRAREPECVDPACSVSSDRCDLHHVVPWPIGLTSVFNLDPGCRRIHLLLTHAGWTYTADRLGKRIWTTPTGLRYVVDLDGNITLRKPGRLPIRPPIDDGPPPF